MNFTQFMLVLKARKWVFLAALLIAVATALALSLITPKSYTSTATLVIDAKGYDPITGVMLPYQLTPNYIATQVGIISSPTVAVRVVRQLGLDKIPALQASFQEDDQGKGNLDRYIAHLLLEKLTVDPSRTSNLVRISFEGRDPRFAALVTNAFAKAYIRTDLDLTTQPAQQSTAWFDQQAKQLSNRLDRAQNALSAYEQQHGLVSDQAMNLGAARLADLSNQMVALQATSIDAPSREKDGAQSPDVINNPVVQALAAQLAQLDAKIADAGRKLGPNNPQYESLLAQRSAVSGQLHIARREAERSYSAQLASLKATYAAQKAWVLKVQKEKDKASVLKQNVASAKLAYDTALQRLSQTMLEANSVQTNVAIVSKATPPAHPSSPRIFLNVAAAVFLGANLGIGLGFLLEFLDRPVRSAQDIELFLDIPVLNGALQRPRVLPGVRQLLLPFKSHSA